MRIFTKKRLFAFLGSFVLTAGIGMVNLKEAKAWTNLVTGDFNTTYEFKGNNEVTYKLTLPSAGKLTQITSVTSRYINFFINNADGERITKLYGESTNAYTTDMELVGGDYFIVADAYYNDTASSFKWVFTPSEESFLENQEERNNALDNSFPVSVTDTVKGHLAINDDVDTYRFSTQKRGALSLKLTTKMPNVGINLVNEEGSFNFSEKEIKKGTKNFTLQLPEGNYFLMVSGENGGNYSFKTSFAKAPSGAKLSSVKNVRKAKLTAKWKSVKGADGYEVQISRSEDFSSYITTKVVKGGKKNAVTFTGLNLNETYPNEYFCRIRTYKSTKGIKAYSDWSEDKSVFIKK